MLNCSSWLLIILNTHPIAHLFSVDCKKFTFLASESEPKMWGLFVAHKNTYQENPTIEDVLKN